jgi:hypothetical protein
MHHGEIEELHLVLRGMCHVTVRLQILAQTLPMQLLLCGHGRLAKVRRSHLSSPLHIAERKPL